MMPFRFLAGAAMGEIIDWNNSFAPSPDRSRSPYGQPTWYYRGTSARSCVGRFRMSRPGSIRDLVRSSLHPLHTASRARDDRRQMQFVDDRNGHPAAASLYQEYRTMLG